MMDASTIANGVLAQSTFTRGGSGGSGDEMLLYVWIGLGVLAVIIQALMAIWVARDARNGGKSPGWAAFVAIPGIGLIGLFIYILIPGGPSPEDIQREQEMAQMRQQMQILQQQSQQAKAEADKKIADAERRAAEAASQPPLHAPMGRKHTTVINAVPSRVVSLTQFGGRNHGMTFSLSMREPDGAVRKSRIGRRASCELSFPEDDAMTSEHCMLLEDQKGDKVCVIDLGSANGTILERGEEKGIISEKTALRDGDFLILGDTRLCVHIIEPEEKAAPVGEFHAS